jgi:hypothetical protein
MGRISNMLPQILSLRIAIPLDTAKLYFPSLRFKRFIPIRKTEDATKKPRKTFPDFTATSSMINARDAATTVPNPLFRPLHIVAPVDHYSLVRITRTTFRNNTYYYRFDARLPAVNSSTTTTVMTAHIAFFPNPLNSGSSMYKSETSVRARPTLRA